MSEHTVTEEAIKFCASMLRTDAGTPFEVRAFLQPLMSACREHVKAETDAAEVEMYWHGESIADAIRHSEQQMLQAQFHQDTHRPALRAAVKQAMDGEYLRR